MSVIGEAIAGAALSAFFDVLFEKLKSPELLNFATETQVRGEIKEWEKKLRKLHLVLEDAEERQIKNRLVKEWLGELRHLTYDVEDILDEFSAESLRRKVMGEPQAATTSKIKKLIPACCASFSPRGVKFNSDMMSKIKDISAKLNGILQEMKDLNLMENVSRTLTKVSNRPLSTSLKDERTVYGRADDKEKILKLLFSYETGNVGVIPIVGMSGMGKTTLAKLVYNDESMPSHFQAKAWVCVSDVFDTLRITKGILESITSESSDLKELNQVQLKLNQALAGKKFLIVLDDVWTGNHNDWHNLCPPLLDAAPGSKIIVTTRSTDVAKMMGTVEYHDLRRISNDDCWLLFKQHAFENRSIAAHAELEKIGREIVNKRCCGLPLAARTLGGLLRSRQRCSEWNEVLNSKLWSGLDGSNNMLSALELSYYYLPSHSKRCFAYCAIFPKNYEFEQKEIILLWMAEGLISQEDGRKSMEELGNKCFLDLLSISFFQASNSNHTRFIMHDLVNDLAQKVAEDTCVRLEDVTLDKGYSGEKARHSTYIQSFCDGIIKFAPFHNMKCLRTFLPLSPQKNDTFYLANSVPNELLQNLKFLRVLSFSRYNITELPSSIGDLKHLRYLNLSYTIIEVLPESVTLLLNLQTLILKNCAFLTKLPTKIGNLVNLCHLDIRGVQLIEGMPLEIKELRGLQTLSDFVIGKESFTITTLMSLKSVGGEICISNLNNVVSASDARKAGLSDKAGIHILELRWNNQAVIEDGEVHYDVLAGLQPHKNLKKLIISFYAGTRFPFWIGDPIFSNITNLRLEDCTKCTSLPQFGMLICLKELFIRNMSSLRRVDREFYGNRCLNPFPSLEVLCFENMNDWEEWNACELGFNILRELSIKNCGKLSGKLPIHPLSLEKLVIRDCESLVVSLSSLPMLSAMVINVCKEVDFECKVDFTSLNMVVLSRISTIKNLAEGFVRRLKKFRNLTVSRSTSSDVSFNRGSSTFECVIDQCTDLVSMMIDDDKEQLQAELAGSELESLALSLCEKLPAWIEKLFLRELIIEGSIPTSEGGIPSMLKVLQVRSCHVCRPFTDMIICNNQSLQELVINSCDFLVSFGQRLLPPTLKKLMVRSCRNLKSLLDGDECESSSFSTTSLEELSINCCDNLTSISSIFKSNLLSKLQSLDIFCCDKLESMGEIFDHNTSLETFVVEYCSSLKSLPDGIHNLTNLLVFKIYGCPCIVSFPEEGLPTSNLKLLWIRELEKLETLPNNMPRLSSLQELWIRDCPSLVSLSSPGFPSNLTTLRIEFERVLPIENIKIGKEVLEWGLDQLNSLQKLSIWGGCPDMVTFPPDEKGIMLPSSLTLLSISDFPNLEYLSTRGFQNLTSLQTLYIWECPKLTSFPKNGLPDSLLELTVEDCPLLKQQYQQAKGPVWSNILNNIPRVKIC